MKALTIFMFELKHFWRSKFKVVALLLFMVAGVYGLHNGAALYQKQSSEIESIHLKTETQKAEILDYFDKGEKGPAARSWVDVTTPFWAIWYTPIYDFKNPSSAMVYSIGQAEQYGFYKRITFWASPYDADMAQEIANPERLQTGTLDFSFVLLFLLPLLLLILVYNLKASEAEQGFLPLIEVQSASKHIWLLARLGFYVVLVFVTCLLLITYGASLTQVFNQNPQAFLQVVLYSLLYLLFWAIIFFFILKNGQTVVANTLKMVGIWLILAFVIPASVHQWVGVKHPTNLMTDFIDAQRDDRESLFALSEDEIITKLKALFPEIEQSVAAKDSTKTNMAMNRSGAALANELVKQGIAPIEYENHEKNKLISASFWLNPVTFFQNKLNSISKTHYEDYQDYRNGIQAKIDNQIKMMVLDMWNDV
ncbi:hypothetical protein, partial [Paucihalobacter sp.]|uniref:hypothetical protein n=1 Tax=Paucihalobacter sp. TaxID=2850405 RepID=UPI002FDF27E5